MIFSDLLAELSSPEFESLRPMQESVLEQYSLLTKERDIGIEMPAGTGKTLVALLIGECHRRLNKRIVILAGTKQLAKQISEDASLLGLDAFVFEGPGQDWSAKEIGKYKRGEIIAIMNYWAYFNIKPKPVPAEILILDDAHLAEHAISGLFSIRLNRIDDNELYKTFIEAIRSLRPNRYSVIDDIWKEIPTDSPFLLPFYDLLSVSGRITQLLDEAVEVKNEKVRFIWPSIRPHLDSLALYVTSYEIQLRPIIFPTKSVRHFNEPLQRIYLTATLGDPNDFQRRIGCDTLHLIRPTNPEPGERGRRMIVILPSKEEGENEVVQRGLKTIWPVARKRFWMCSSWREAEYWKQWVPPLKNGTRTHIFELRGADETQLEEFRKTNLGHLFTAARYDGIDLPGDQCHFAIITSSPVTSDPQEEFFSTYLKDATFLKSRFSQRVAQALGRCNRSASDFAVYVLLDPRFERRFGGSDPDYVSFLPFDIQPEMEAAIECSEEGFVKCCETAKSFLLMKFEQWDHLVEKLRSKVKTTQSVSSLNVQSELDGWFALWQGDPGKATELFQKFEKDCEKQNIKGPLALIDYCVAWTRYLSFLRQGDPKGLEDAISLLEKAASVGPPSLFTSILRTTANDLRREAKKPEKTISKENSYRDSIFGQWEEILYERGQKEGSLNKWLNKIQEDIKSDNHDQVCDGIKKLGTLVGFDSFRPEGFGMPDVVWKFSFVNRYIITWEVKTETSADKKIAIKDVNQSHGHGRWAEENFASEGYKCYPLIMSRTIEFEKGAFDRLGNVKCLPQSVMGGLAEKVKAVFNEFRIVWSTNEAEKRTEAREKCLRKIPNFEWLIQAIASAKKGLISEETLLSNWK